MIGTASGRAFDRVLIIMFENMYRGYVIQNPYMRDLAAQGIDLANFHGVMHPSQTNYISSIAGELCNVSDDRPPLLTQDTIVDLIEASPEGLAWKAYMDGYCPATTPWTPELVPQDNFPYLIKHNPFSSFANIVRNEDRWKRVVSAHQFFEDVATNTLPEYGWCTPDMWNDGHYSAGTQTGPPERAPALVDQQAVWLRYLFGMLQFPGPDSIVPDGTLVVVTYDEADFEAAFDPTDKKKYTYDGPNQIYTVLLGSMVTPGVETEGYNHYSLIRTIEENFDLETLGKNDQHANWFQFLWGRRFAWRGSEATPFVAGGPIACACHRGVPTLGFRDGEGHLCVARYTDATWTTVEVVGDGGDGPFALAVAHDTLYLVFSSNDAIRQCTYDTSGWSAAGPVLSAGPVGALALVAFDEGRQLMLVWSDEAGRLFSLTEGDGTWATEPVVIGAGSEKPFITQGAVCLAVLGSSIFCIFESARTDALLVVSYNCAAYNVITAGPSKYSGPYNNTTVGLWSPSAFPVEAFAGVPSPITPGEPEPHTEMFPGRAPLACATLDGVIHLAHGTARGNHLVTETMSINGLLTPKLPVSYASSDQITTNNGYGTLAQAGWTEQTAVEGTSLGSQLALAMCCDGPRLWLAYAEPSGAIIVRTGSYQPAHP